MRPPSDGQPMTAKRTTPHPVEFQPPVWRQPDGKPVACHEKIKVLNENLAEIRQLAQDALEDAILMGCDEAQIRKTFDDMLSALRNPYVKKR